MTVAGEAPTALTVDELDGAVRGSPPVANAGRGTRSSIPSWAARSRAMPT